MYPQHPYGYVPASYSAPFMSAGYAPYYPAEPQHANSVRPPAPPPARPPQQQRLSIRDPKTGAEVPVVTPQQVEQAVAKYHKERLPQDLVSLDLDDLAEKCQAMYRKDSDSAEPQLPDDFAFSQLQPAAKQGLPHCQYYLGRCYETNQGGLPGNQDLCKVWFKQASDQGVLEASYKLGQCCEDGWGCPQSMPEAVRLYKIAADGGVQAAKLRLGFLHEVGNGVPQDPEAAFNLYRQALDLIEGAMCAARCHESGSGTEVDLRKAKAMYQRAYNKGSWQAADCLAVIDDQIAMRDKWHVSSKQPANQSVINQPEDKMPEPVAVTAVAASQDEQQDASPGGSHPNPQAKPFVPKGQPTATLKPHAKEFRPQASSTSSASTAATTPPRKVPKIAPPTGATAKAGLTAQAPAFQPKQAESDAQPVSENAQASSAASVDAKQPPQSDAATTSISDNEQMAGSSAIKHVTKATPSKDQTMPSSPVKDQHETKAGTDVTRLKTAASTASSAVVEDLDVLHTEQMSAAWAALDAATGSNQPDIGAIEEALRHARPYRELAECVRAAEDFVFTLRSQSLEQLPSSQQSEPQLTESQQASDQHGDDAEAQAEHSMSHGWDGSDQHDGSDQQDGAANIDDSKAVGAASAQQHDQFESHGSHHQDADYRDLHDDSTDPLAVSHPIVSIPVPIQMGTKDKAFTLSPKDVATAKAAATLALAQPVHVHAAPPFAPTSSVPSSSPTSHSQHELHSELSSQQEQHAQAEGQDLQEPYSLAETDQDMPSVSKPKVLSQKAAAKPPGSMSDFLSFLLPAENLAAKPAPARRQPPGFESPHPPDIAADSVVAQNTSLGLGPPDQLTVSTSGRGASLSATQDASPHPQGHQRRAKAYQSIASRGPAAPYQPPGLADTDEAAQQQPHAVYEPLQERQAPSGSAVPQRPPLYVPAPVQPNSVTGHSVSALAYNPAGVGSDTEKFGTEKSTDDILAELLGLPKAASAAVPEAVAPASPAELDVDIDAFLTQQLHSPTQHSSTASAALQPQVYDQELSFVPSGETLTAETSLEAVDSQAAARQHPAHTQHSGLNMEPQLSHDKVSAGAQASSSKADSEPDTDAQSSSSKADSVAASQAKRRAVDDDYSMSSSKARGKSKKKGSPVKPASATQAPVSDTQSDATADAYPASASSAAAWEIDSQRPAVARTTSNSSLGVAPSFLPPKPKPGGTKPKSARPVVAEPSAAVEQPHILAPRVIVQPRPQAQAPAKSHKAQQPAARRQPHKQSSSDLQAALQARLTPQPHAAEPSGQQHEDGDEWETVGHKGTVKQAPARKQGNLNSLPVQQPQQAQENAVQEIQSVQKQPSAEAPAAAQPLFVPQKPIVPPTVAPNSAWVKKLDLQSANSGTNAAAPGAPASPLPAVPSAAHDEPSQQDQPKLIPATAATAAEPHATSSDSDAKPSASAADPVDSAQPSGQTESAAANSSSADAPASSDAAAAPFGADQPKQGARPASAGQKPKNRGRKKRGLGKLPDQAGQPQPVAAAAASGGASNFSAGAAAAPSQPIAVQSNTGSQAAEDIVHRQKEAMMTVMADGMKVTANNKDAWNEICTCPLSLDIMREPVVAYDGITYEREQIAKWLSNHDTSPWTSITFEHKDLTPNILVSRLINKFNLGNSES